MGLGSLISDARLVTGLGSDSLTLSGHSSLLMSSKQEEQVGGSSEKEKTLGGS